MTQVSHPKRYRNAHYLNNIVLYLSGKDSEKIDMDKNPDRG